MPTSGVLFGRPSKDLIVINPKKKKKMKDSNVRSIVFNNRPVVDHIYMRSMPVLSEEEDGD